MDRLINEIRSALHAGMFTLALQGALALVDICSALGSADGRTKNTRFKQWFQENLAELYPRLNGDDMYLLRCGMLHQGRTASDQYSAIVFTLPDGSGNMIHNGMTEDVLVLDLNMFCNDVIRSAEQWWEQNRTSEPVSTNSKDIARVRLEGFPPHVGGVPVLA